MLKIIQGIIIGFIIVLPGMSGGTVLLIFGMYEQLVKDISKLNLKPYLPFGIGLLSGIYLGGAAFSLFFQNYRDATVAFLLGCLLASIKPVLENCPKPGKNGILSLIIGLVIGYIMIDEAIGGMVINIDINWVLLTIGGALASAAMLLPGIPGSSVLIMLGIYDSMIYSIAELNIFNLGLFGLGSIIGILLLANILDTFYSNHRVIVSYFFAGLILGSCRGIIPSDFEWLYIFLFLIGFSIVWKYSLIKQKKTIKKESLKEVEAEQTT
jgi:putative membrane protein